MTLKHMIVVENQPQNWCSLESLNMKSQRTPLVSSDGLLGLREAAKELGISIDAELEEFGLSLRLLDDPRGFLPLSQVSKFLNAVATRHNCPQLGLLIGKHRPKTRFGILTQLIKVCPDVGTALRKGHAHLEMISQNTLWELKIEDGFASLIRRDREFLGVDLTQLHILSVTQYFELLVAFLGDHWHPASVSFVHQAPENIQPYKKLFQAPVHFGQSFDGLIFPARDLLTRIPSYDPILLAIIEKHIETLEHEADQKSMEGKVDALIRQTMGTSGCTLEGVAQKLGIHPKALQRRLKSSQQSFKQLLANARHEFSEYYLSESNISLIQLADILGYSSPSAFSRAFSQHYGIPPKQWREKQQRHLKI